MLELGLGLELGFPLVASEGECEGIGLMARIRVRIRFMNKCGVHIWLQ